MKRSTGLFIALRSNYDCAVVMRVDVVGAGYRRCRPVCLCRDSLRVSAASSPVTPPDRGEEEVCVCVGG